jgi:hypothetical protein
MEAYRAFNIKRGKKHTHTHTHILMHSKYKTFVLLLFIRLWCDNEYLPLSAAEEKAKEKPKGND